MGNTPGKRSPTLDALFEKFNDPELTRLDLRSKNLEEVPPQITLLQKLVWLNLPNNHLVSLPDYLFDLPELKTLRLLGNQLSDIPESIANLSDLRSLDLSKNDFLEVSDNIASLTALTDLNYHWNLVEKVLHISSLCTDLTHHLLLIRLLISWATSQR